MGMIAGTYTDPPALAYANASCSKEAPAVGYSTVYPLSMFLRIFIAQICVLFFCAVLTVYADIGAYGVERVYSSVELIK